MCAYSVHLGNYLKCLQFLQARHLLFNFKFINYSLSFRSILLKLIFDEQNFFSLIIKKNLSTEY